MSSYYSARGSRRGNSAVQISSWGLGDSAFPLDYVFSGAEVLYQATFTGWQAPPTWKQATDGLRLTVTSNFDVRHDEENERSGSIFYDFVVRGDFHSINDLKSWMDGAVMSSGFPLAASMIRFVSNPRRDQVVQPPVGTPGVDPTVTTVPPGTVDTGHQPPGILDVGSAADWWGSGISSALDSIGSPLGITSTTAGLLIGLALFMFMRR